MSITGTAVPQAPVNQAAIEQKLRLESVVKRGAGWFLAVAGFSVINSLLMMSGAKVNFIVGLGVTQIAAGIGKTGGTVGGMAGLIVSLFAAGVFALFWKFAREGHAWAFLIGMILYGLDGLIFLGFGLWLDLAFHAYALFNMYKGLEAVNARNRIQA